MEFNITYEDRRHIITPLLEGSQLQTDIITFGCAF